jgi:ubiquinone/menaquinone biosynthesis C-methylase UbiE
MAAKSPPNWQLPPGVTRGLWDYVQSAEIAEDYDDFFAFNTLFEFDEQVLARHFSPPGVVADLGCGTGRALIPLVRRGFQGLAIDMSDRMLDIVRKKSRQEHLPIECVRANLVELDAVPDDQVDYAMCLFSTLGMIQGRAHRRRALGHVRRIVKPGGLFVVHAHNFWFNLFDPDGPWWLIRNVLRSTFRRDVERGDKYFPYRGVPNMFLHVFTRGELKHDLRQAGFRLREVIPLHTSRQKRLPRAWLAGGIRANGWIVVCQ